MLLSILLTNMLKKIKVFYLDDRIIQKYLTDDLDSENYDNIEKYLSWSYPKVIKNNSVDSFDYHKFHRLSHPLKGILS